jgi:hypothetical protein
VIPADGHPFDGGRREVTYQVICAIEGHPDAGMSATLHVV